MDQLQRNQQEAHDRTKIYEQWEKFNEVIVEYGNFCIKMLVTLNSSAIIACIAFLGTYSKNIAPTALAVTLNTELPRSMFLWTVSLTLILAAALFTYLCHRMYQPMLNVWHKSNYTDLHGQLSKKECVYLKLYDVSLYTGIWTGILSLAFFVWGIWNITLAMN